MQMLYNSENFAVVRFDIPSLQPTTHAADAAPAVDTASAVDSAPAVDTAPAVTGTQDLTTPLPQDALLSRGGYEIVDKFARKGIFIQGAVARSFKDGVQALIDAGPTEEALDDYIAGYTRLAQLPVNLH